jgi:hypothetical protein
VSPSPCANRFDIAANRLTVPFRPRSGPLTHNAFIMTRALAITLALLVAAAPFGAASAQDRGHRGDGGRQEQSRDQGRDQGGRMISEAQAQSIAQSRARGARFVGSRGLQGGSYVFVFDDNGRIFQISVSASGN